ncbi:hypothetical protein B7494_g8322 [Chlorociboria aeruginascens]|nr:hypothetical protein B7494_g8322 [Chlorociboria aeruginascens]
MLFFSFFKTLVDHEVTVELKNDIQIRGTLKSVDQYLNIKLDDIQVIEELKSPMPSNTARTSQPSSKMPTRVSSSKPPTPRPNSNVLVASRQSTKKVIPGKVPTKANQSILNFFKKVDSPLNDDSIFLPQGSRFDKDLKARSPSLDSLDGDIEGLDNDVDGRYNEAVRLIKRRKLSPEIEDPQGTIMTDYEVDGAGDEKRGSTNVVCSPPPPGTSITVKKPLPTGPFILDSDTEDEVEDQALQAAAVAAEKMESDDIAQSEVTIIITETKPINQEEIKENHRPVIPPMESAMPTQNSIRRKKVPIREAQAKWEALRPKESSGSSSDEDQDYAPSQELNRTSSAGNPKHKISAKEYFKSPPIVPALERQNTSVDEWAGFDDIEDVADDEFGEEFVERKWMEEQARLEATEEEPFEDFDETERTPDEGMTAVCPICDASLDGITPDEATRHVNGCLDGSPIPLPALAKPSTSKIKFMPAGANNRFARKAAVARPGQANPFEIEKSGATSAFSQIMSGHAEDAAWASAASAETAARGKPAYQRTCPFYKIMPGFFICVDAFRYGAVQGCKAYFLSHFHSDHYVGLSSTWCHGLIYCSKVTANLVKQQLRVDPQWVVALDFEAKFEVPDTEGVAVTMIPANHCPGSSLYLFEKIIGRGANPKTQRVLHCGDFRACPAHVAHPLLVPDVVDSVSGKIKQQKIDVCYLDTTYLNPRYAFPSQEAVIKACADMCVSLTKERAEETDAWETSKRERAGAGMSKFLSSKVLPSDSNSIAMEIGSTKQRGRLLVVCGTYSIGKERICMGIARALDCKIWAPPGKMRICAALEDEELMSRMTDDPKEAQIHMQMLMEIRAETLQEYLNGYKPYFSRIVGFRPSGWNYRPPGSRSINSPTISHILQSPTWHSRFMLSELVPQRGSTREASCFGVPYSEHSSFRELTMFVCALRIEKVVPTVNVSSGASRAKMKSWIEKWLTERRKNGVLKFGEEEGEVRW